MDHLVNCLWNTGYIQDVQGISAALYALGFNLGLGFFGQVQPVWPVRHRNVGSGLGQTHRQGGADAPAGSGYQRGLTF